MTEVTAKSYTLYDEKGNWLGQVVLTSDGMFSGVTDWGNFGYSWRSYSGTFEEFLSGLNTSYFSSKMSTGMAYVARSRAIDKACDRFAEKILPALQQVLKEELKTKNL
jgi:hypothetical protein